MLEMKDSLLKILKESYSPNVSVHPSIEVLWDQAESAKLSVALPTEAFVSEGAMGKPGLYQPHIRQSEPPHPDVWGPLLQYYIAMEKLPFL